MYASPAAIPMNKAAQAYRSLQLAQIATIPEQEICFVQKNAAHFHRRVSDIKIAID